MRDEDQIAAWLAKNKPTPCPTVHLSASESCRDVAIVAMNAGESEEDTWERLYLKERISVRLIAAMFGCDDTKVSAALKARGIKLRMPRSLRAAKK